MDDIRVRDYASVSSLVLPQNFVDKARFPAIDIHAHSNARKPEGSRGVGAHDGRGGVETTVVLTGATGDPFDRMADLYLKRADRFQVYCGVLAIGLDEPDYPAKAGAELERCYRKGARGIGELSDKGLGFAGGPSVPRNIRACSEKTRLRADCSAARLPKIEYSTPMNEAFRAMQSAETIPPSLGVPFPAPYQRAAALERKRML